MRVTIEDVLDGADGPSGRLSPAAVVRNVGAAVRLVWHAARWEFTLVLVLQVLTGLASAAQVLVAARVVGAVVANARSGGSAAGLAADLLAMAALTAGLGALALVQQERQRLVGELVRWHASGRVLAAAVRAELADFDDPAFHDRLQRARLTAEVRPMQLAIGLIGTIGAVAGALGLGVALFALSPLLGGLMVVSAVPLWLAGGYSSRALYRFSYRMTASDRERYYLTDLLVGRDEAKEVRAYGLGPMLRGRFDELSAARVDAMRRLSRRRIVVALTGSAGNAGCVGGVVLLTVWLSATGRLTLAQAGAAVVAAALLGQRLSVATGGITMLYESALFVADLAAFTAPPPEPAAEAPLAGFAGVAVRRVSFRYPGRDTDALDGVSLDIRPGEVVALVGENGSGKTTLAKIVAGLYSPDRGTIGSESLPGGRPVTAAELRQAVAITFQDFVRYRFSLADNIAVGRPDRTDPADRCDAVADAGRRAGVDTFLAGLPDGYQTLLGPEFAGGWDLSVGQWQRVALARAFFRDAPLLILDEPTASLDARAERALFDDIRTLCAGRTVLVITHRFANVRAADRIYVLAGGRVVEHGTHAELLAAAGRYAELYALQAQPWQDAPGYVGGAPVDA